MNPYADEESGNKFEDDNLCDIDLDKDNANSHLALSKEILSSQSFLTTKTSEVGSNGSSPTKTDKSRNNRVSARSMDEIAAQLLEGETCFCNPMFFLKFKLTEKKRSSISN